MTPPAHHRDPRMRRAGGVFAPPVDALTAAVRLEVAADAMRADHRAAGPAGGPADEAPLPADVFAPPPWPPVQDEAPAPVAPVLPAPPPAPAFAGAVAAASANEPGMPDLRGPAPAVFSSEHPRLTWRSRHDERSRAYAVRDRLAGAAPLQDVMLPTGPVLDQGAEGACVGNGVADAVNVLRRLHALSPATMLGEADALELYHAAQRIDERPGEDYSGTSVLAGMKAGRAAGLFGAYWWAFGTRDIADTLIGRRLPVIVGVPWLSGMYATGPGGLVKVEGSDEGAGHCLVVVALRMRGPQGQPGPYFGWLNSWGPSYGDGGIGWVHHRDLTQLLAGFGEAAVPAPHAR